MLLTAAKLALAPVLIVQGRRVRRLALRLPEAAGARAAVAGSGARPLRLLIVGDSATAGVGVARQRDALAGRLAAHLSSRLGTETHRVHWRLVARTGATTADALVLLDETARARRLQADVAVVGLGVNDVTGQVPPARWLRTLETLVQRLEQRHGVQLTVVSGLPPMHLFPALPQPLRWFLGATARRHDRALHAWARSRPATVVAPMPALTDPALMAADGFHPGPAACNVWADALASTIVEALAPALADTPPPTLVDASSPTIADTPSPRV